MSKEKKYNEEDQLRAVSIYGDAIAGIDNPSVKVQLEAVNENPYAIRFIKNPDEMVQLVAMKDDAVVLECIDNPCQKAKIQYEKERQKVLKGIRYIYNHYNTSGEEYEIPTLWDDFKDLFKLNKKKEVKQYEAI